MEQILKKLGLTNHEIKVYLALLKLGSINAGEIIKEVKLHRAGVYDALDRLITKGLASYVIRANRKYFEASQPKNLFSILENKEIEIKSEKEELNSAMASLDKIRKLSSESQEATLFKGRKGIKSIFDDILAEKKEIFTIGAYSETANSLVSYLKYDITPFHKKRIAEKIKMKFIFPEQSKKRAIELKKSKFVDIRILPAHFASSVSYEIYGDKVAIIIWTEEPVGLLMRSKDFANNQKQYFDVLWNIAKPI